MDKIYIGDVEAWEVAQDRGIDELPTSGKEIITCYSIADDRNDEVLGKDGKGFYLREQNITL